MTHHQKVKESVKEWTEALNRHFFQRAVEMANRHMKGAQDPANHQEMKITKGYHLTPVGMGITKKAHTHTKKQYL